MRSILLFLIANTLQLSFAQSTSFGWKVPLENFTMMANETTVFSLQDYAISDEWNDIYFTSDNKNLTDFTHLSSKIYNYSLNLENIGDLTPYMVTSYIQRSKSNETEDSLHTFNNYGHIQSLTIDQDTKFLYSKTFNIFLTPEKYVIKSMNPINGILWVSTFKSNESDPNRGLASVSIIQYENQYRNQIFEFDMKSSINFNYTQNPLDIGHINLPGVGEYYYIYEKLKFHDYDFASINKDLIYILKYTKGDPKNQIDPKLEVVKSLNLYDQWDQKHPQPALIKIVSSDYSLHMHGRYWAAVGDDDTCKEAILFNVKPTDNTWTKFDDAKHLLPSLSDSPYIQDFEKLIGKPNTYIIGAAIKPANSILSFYGTQLELYTYDNILKKISNIEHRIIDDNETQIEDRKAIIDIHVSQNKQQNLALWVDIGIGNFRTEGGPEIYKLTTFSKGLEKIYYTDSATGQAKNYMFSHVYDYETTYFFDPIAKGFDVYKTSRQTLKIDSNKISPNDKSKDLELTILPHQRSNSTVVFDPAKVHFRMLNSFNEFPEIINGNLSFSDYHTNLSTDNKKVLYTQDELFRTNGNLQFNFEKNGVLEITNQVTMQSLFEPTSEKSKLLKTDKLVIEGIFMAQGESYSPEFNSKNWLIIKTLDDGSNKQVLRFYNCPELDLSQNIPNSLGCDPTEIFVYKTESVYFAVYRIYISKQQLFLITWEETQDLIKKPVFIVYPPVNHDQNYSTIDVPIAEDDLYDIYFIPLGNYDGAAKVQKFGYLAISFYAYVTFFEINSNGSRQLFDLNNKVSNFCPKYMANTMSSPNDIYILSGCGDNQSQIPTLMKYTLKLDDSKAMLDRLVLNEITSLDYFNNQENFDPKNIDICLQENQIIYVYENDGVQAVYGTDLSKNGSRQVFEINNLGFEGKSTKFTCLAKIGAFAITGTTNKNSSLFARVAVYRGSQNKNANNRVAAIIDFSDSEVRNVQLINSGDNLILIGIKPDFTIWQIKYVFINEYHILYTNTQNDIDTSYKYSVYNTTLTGTVNLTTSIPENNVTLDFTNKDVVHDKLSINLETKNEITGPVYGARLSSIDTSLDIDRNVVEIKHRVFQRFQTNISDTNSYVKSIVEITKDNIVYNFGIVVAFDQSKDNTPMSKLSVAQQDISKSNSTTVLSQTLDEHQYCNQLHVFDQNISSTGNNYFVLALCNNKITSTIIGYQISPDFKIVKNIKVDLNSLYFKMKIVEILQSKDETHLLTIPIALTKKVNKLDELTLKYIGFLLSDNNPLDYELRQIDMFNDFSSFDILQYDESITVIGSRKGAGTIEIITYVILAFTDTPRLSNTYSISSQNSFAIKDIFCNFSVSGKFECILNIGQNYLPLVEFDGANVEGIMKIQIKNTFKVYEGYKPVKNSQRLNKNNLVFASKDYNRSGLEDVYTIMVYSRINKDGSKSNNNEIELFQSQPRYFSKTVRELTGDELCLFNNNIYIQTNNFLQGVNLSANIDEGRNLKDYVIVCNNCFTMFEVDKNFSLEIKSALKLQNYNVDKLNIDFVGPDGKTLNTLKMDSIITIDIITLWYNKWWNWLVIAIAFIILVTAICVIIKVWKKKEDKEDIIIKVWEKKDIKEESNLYDSILDSLESNLDNSEKNKNTTPSNVINNTKSNVCKESVL